MPLPEREQVGKCDTFSKNNPGIIRKCRGFSENAITAERASIMILWQREYLIDMSLQSFRADPAPETGETLHPVLQ
ncbi:MAG: hypothetical protein STSR0009_08540 [Methanoregula sp.]